MATKILKYCHTDRYDDAGEGGQRGRGENKTVDDKARKKEEDQSTDDFIFELKIWKNSWCAIKGSIDRIFLTI